MKSIRYRILWFLALQYSGAHSVRRFRFVFLYMSLALPLCYIPINHRTPTMPNYALQFLNIGLIWAWLKLKRHLTLDDYRNPFSDWADNLVKATAPISDEDFTAVMGPLGLPSLRLRRSTESHALVASQLGGLPDLPLHFVWPTFKDLPLSFIAQLRLSTLAPFPGAESLPPVGMLYFFYVQDQSSWGIDIRESEAARVIYHPFESELIKAEAPPGLRDDAIYKSIPWSAEAECSYPDIMDPAIPGPDEVTREKLSEKLQAQHGKGPIHRIFGHPDLVQGDVFVECQMVTNGISFQSSPKRTPEEDRAIEQAAKNWKLLLQVDSDSDTNMMWGDGGRLYYCIKGQDLLEKKFENAWMILQCY